MTLARFDGVTKSSMPCALLDLTFLARRRLPGKSGSLPLMASRRSREDPPNFVSEIESVVG